MAALGAQSIASSYEQLLHVDRDDGGNSTTLVAVKDGDNGTTFDIQLSSNSTNFQTDFKIGGTAVSSTAAELNLLDGSSVTNATVSKAVVLDSSGNIALPNGKGISFAATADGGVSTPSELFDDYEEGAWTPTLTGNLSGTLTGWYTKIGNTVNLWGALASIDWNGSGTTATVIGGLPFTSTNTSAKKNYFTISPFGLNTTSTHVVLLGLSYGAVVIDVNEQVDNGAHIAVNESAFPTSGGTTLRFNVTYTV